MLVLFTVTTLENWDTPLYFAQHAMGQSVIWIFGLLIMMGTCASLPSLALAPSLLSQPNIRSQNPR